MCRVINQINLTKTVERRVSEQASEMKKEHKTNKLAVVVRENNKLTDGTMRTENTETIGEQESYGQWTWANTYSKARSKKHELWRSFNEWRWWTNRLSERPCDWEEENSWIIISAHYDANFVIHDLKLNNEQFQMMMAREPIGLLRPQRNANDSWAELNWATCVDMQMGKMTHDDSISWLFIN